MNIPKIELEEIKSTDLKKKGIYTIVTRGPEIEQAKVNLLASLIINPAKRSGKQVGLKRSDYNIEHSIFDELEKEKFKRHPKTS